MFSKEEISLVQSNVNSNIFETAEEIAKNPFVFQTSNLLAQGPQQVESED